MASTFFGLNIAYSGLLASNAGMNTTANNISNVQTEGFSRQQVDQRAAEALRTWQAYGCAGAGVQTLAIERIRDEFYDQKFWNNNTYVGEYNMKSYYMAEMEDYFYDSGTNGGFSTIFDTLMKTGMQELLKNPGDTTTKTQFVGYAGSLTDYFNSITGNLQNMQKDVNAELKLKIDEINSIGAEIATLNEQINTVEMGGNHANELRDRRTVLLDKLSEIVDVTTIENQVMDLNDPERETGATRFIVKIAGGQLLVDANQNKKLECVARQNFEKVNQTDIDGLYDVYWQDGQRFNLNNAAMGGALKGLVAMRDGNNGEFFHGTVTATTVGTTEDTVTVSVSDSYLMDLNQCNLSDQGGIITLGNVQYNFSSWDMTCSVDAAGEVSYSYTFHLPVGTDLGQNDTHITNDRVDKEAAIGSAVRYQGIPYYMNQLNEWVRTFSEKFNDILLAGNDGTGTMMFTGNHATDSEQYQFPKDTDGYRFDTFSALADAGDTSLYGKSITVTSSEDSYYQMTAENFSVLRAMINDPGLMTNKYRTGDGVEQNDLLEDLSKMVTDKSAASFRGNSASEFLESLLSDVALNASSSNTFKSSYTTMQKTIDTTRLSISGVDQDEEAVNLIKYQNAYNLSSKMISVFQEIYNKLINETGV
ncbi:MAG: flagellar hook-associated protein FlgK [Lachnospiraceae bacterium]|nr:flagellar hook-associated protein FlgK [Lachnospiraceae bacterium]